MELVTPQEENSHFATFFFLSVWIVFDGKELKWFFILSFRENPFMDENPWKRIQNLAQAYMLSSNFKEINFNRKNEVK